MLILLLNSYILIAIKLITFTKRRCSGPLAIGLTCPLSRPKENVATSALEADAVWVGKFEAKNPAVLQSMSRTVYPWKKKGRFDLKPDLTTSRPDRQNRKMSKTKRKLFEYTTTAFSCTISWTYTAVTVIRYMSNNYGLDQQRISLAYLATLRILSTRVKHAKRINIY